jgi:hypothetical protein
MSLHIRKPRRPRKDAHYSRDEINILNKFKEEYRQQTTRELRAHVFKTKVLVDMFNFWLDRENGAVDEEESVERMKVNPSNLN